MRFFYLGVNQNVIRNCLVSRAHYRAQTQHAQSQVSTTLHARSCVRAMDKIQVMREDSVNPAEAQQYLSRWASWWARTAPITSTHCLTRWVQQALKRQPDLCWLALWHFSGFVSYDALSCDILDGVNSVSRRERCWVLALYIARIAPASILIRYLSRSHIAYDSTC